MKPANSYFCFFLPVWLMVATSTMAWAKEPPTQTSLINYSDTSITLLHGAGFEIDPHLQTTVTIEHFSDWAFGDLFAFIDYYKFHNADTDWYGEFSPRLSLGKISGYDLSFALFHSNYLVVEDMLIAGTYERGEKPDLSEAFLLGLGFDFVDITDQIEGLLWKAVKFAGENLIEAADGVFEFHVLTRHPGEDLSHEEGLGQELLDFASTVNCLAVNNNEQHLLELW